MTPTETYVMYATIAEDMAAAETVDPEHRLALLEIAQSWRRLAAKAEQSHDKG